MEKRAVERHSISAKIVCAPLTTLQSAKACEGRMLNYSDGGMCIESNATFVKGAPVVIKVIDISRGSFVAGISEGFRTISLTEVKWKRFSDDAATTFYGMQNY